jgi:hypothetical protein
MLYQYMKHTTRNRKGDMVEMNPSAIRTIELLRGGFIKPVAQPSAAARETKIVAPEEIKPASPQEIKRRGRPRKVKADDSADA